MEDPLLVIKIAHPNDREIVEKHYSDSVNGINSACCIDFRIINRDGEERWIGHSCQPVYDTEGRYIGQRGSNRDITERKKAELLLISSQQQLRDLARHNNKISEEERTRIAREIHDELGHILTTLKYDIDRLKEMTDLSGEHAREELAPMSSMLDSLIDTVRKIATELRPGVLDHLGLCPAIEWQVEQFRRRTDIACELTISVGDSEFEKDVTTNVFRIFQEILTNVARHSGASKIRVSFSRMNEGILLVVEDNGAGFDACHSYKMNSLGLVGMQERALSIGGQLKIESRAGEGTTVSLLINKQKVLKFQEANN